MKKTIAIVTGGAQGIGLAIAHRLAAQGKLIALFDLNPDALERAVAEIRAEGFEAQGFVVDVTDRESVESTIYDLDQRPEAIGILVNNAGVIRDGFISNLSDEDWDLVLDTNLKGAFLCCRAVFPILRAQRRGKIVNIVSRAWLGNIGQANYSASKGGLVSLTRTLALEFARYLINVNAVAPGLIDTEMTRGMPEKARERLLRMQPTGEMGVPEDIAAATAFLASDEAKFITGQVLHVDGGKSCGLLSL